MSCPPDLERLYDLYEEEKNQPLIKGDDLSSFSSFEKIPSLTNMNIPQTPRLSEDIEENNNKKVFTRSAKAKQIQQAEELSKNWKDDHPGLLSPHNQSANPSRLSYEDRDVINAKTRNIAALAAKKRNKVQANVVGGNGVRPLYRPPPHHVDDNDFDDFGGIITPTRFPHDNDDMADRHSLLTEQSLPPVKTIASVGSRRIVEQEESRRRAVRYGGNGNSNMSSSYLEKSRGRKYIDQSQSNRQRRRHLSNTNGNHLRIPGNGRSEDRGISPTPSIAVDRNRRNPNSKPRKKQTGQPLRAANVVTPVSDKSFVSTPQVREKKTRPLPTIPQYRKGDIAITGTATGTNTIKF